MIEERGTLPADSPVHGVSSTHMGYDSVHCTCTGDWSLRYSRNVSEVTCADCRKAMGADEQIPEGHRYYNVTAYTTVAVHLTEILAKDYNDAVNRAKSLVDLDTVLNSSSCRNKHVRHVKRDSSRPVSFLVEDQPEGDVSNPVNRDKER